MQAEKSMLGRLCPSPLFFGLASVSLLQQRSTTVTVDADHEEHDSPDPAADELIEGLDREPVGDAVADEPTGSDNPLSGKRVAFLGRLGSMTRREAQRLVRQAGGTPVDSQDPELDLLVLGADELPINEAARLPENVQEAAARGQLQIVSETQLWQQLGFVDDEQHVKRLYTPAMLAQLLDVSVAVIRRWHRRGLIVPTREVHRLPYFDFQEVATARRLAELLTAGAKPEQIERQLAQLARLVPDVERPLAQLSVIVEGRDLLLRQGEGLIEPGGQMRLDFSCREEFPPGANESSATDADASPPNPRVLPMQAWLAQQVEQPPSSHEMLEWASQFEDEGLLDEAIEMYRVALVAAGPRAEVCFRLAELLYLSGDVAAARERYSMAIELDEDYVEARANLGCVLAETGKAELAVAAFQGALRSHPDYPDVHYHLARILDDLGRDAEATVHWQRFLELTPDSPWAEEARLRLESWPL
jgi:tetratricopeptide (TPR) repeat protein